MHLKALPELSNLRIRRPLLVGMLGLLLTTQQLATPAEAGEWMFRRSYYSHALPSEQTPDYPLPKSRSAYRSALVGTHPGFSVRGAYRWNRVQMRSGSSVDTTILRSFRFEVQP